MTTKKPNDPGAQRLTSYLSPASAWALAVGTSVGWGALVVTASGYLSQAGPTAASYVDQGRPPRNDPEALGQKQPP